jgi:hypothetical protein
MGFLNFILLEVDSLQYIVLLILIRSNNINKDLKMLLKHKVSNQIFFHLREEVYQCKVVRQIIDCKL